MMPTPDKPNLLVAWSIHPERFYLNIFSRRCFYTHRDGSWQPKTSALSLEYIDKLQQAYAYGHILFAIPTSASTPAEVELLHPELFL